MSKCIIYNAQTNLYWQIGEWKQHASSATKYPSKDEAEAVILFKSQDRTHVAFQHAQVVEL